MKSGHDHWRLHPHVRTGNELAFGERAADVLKHWFGTWTILGLTVAVMVATFLFLHDPGHLDLNLGLSLMAAVQGIILQISANRGDKINAEHTTATHLNTEWLKEVNKTQLEILEELRAKNNSGSS